MNNPRRMLEVIGAKYSLIIRNETHVQIKLDKGKFHDFWPVYRCGGLRMRLFGMQKSIVYFDINEIMKKLERYDYQTNSDLSRMYELDRIFKKTQGKTGVFCDAGFKEGLSKLAVIRVFGTEIDLHVRQSENYANNMEAEIAAIRFAMKLFPDAPEIFSDSTGAVDSIIADGVPSHQRIIWIGRDANKAADKFSNLRASG